MAANLLQDFGNGLGYVYITQADGTTIVSNIENSTYGVSVVKNDALISAPLAGNIASYGTITFGGVNNNVNGLTVNGVAIISGAVAAAGTIALTVAAVRDNINAFTSAPDYTAISIGTTLYIIADPALGSSPNGYAVATLTVMTTAIVDMHGGCNTTGIYDQATGHRYFLNADYDVTGCSGAGTAVEGSLVDSVEISKYVINRGFQNSLPTSAPTIANGIVTIPRTSCITVVNIETEGGVALDDLNTISPVDFNLGDILVIRGINPIHKVNLKQAVGAGDNIQLANGTDYLTGVSTRTIALELVTIGATLYWSELFRTPNLDLSLTNMRNAGFAMPASGVTDNTLTLAAQIISLTPGSSVEYQRIIGTGPLTGNVSVVFAGVPKNGDHFFIDYRATITLGAFSIVIGTVTLTLTQALEGGYMVYCYYDLPNLIWRCSIYKSTQNEDLVDTVQLATKENYLGLPGQNGYVLSSTTLGTRSWTPINRHVLYDVVTNNATTAVIVRENLKSFTLPANSLDQDGTATGGSQIIVEAIFQTAANNNNKTFGISFGATDVISYSAGAPTNNTTIYLRVTINRVTQVAQSCLATYQNDGLVNGLLYTTPVENLAAPVIINAFGINGVASAGDIISRSMTVTYI
jgi:hypothetical protein